MAVTTTEAARKRRSLRALARSTSGNTMALMGAAMIPLAAMTGSAIDMSRLYMVKVRLQQACDAGALAGRRFMSGTTLDASAEAEARKFFTANFPTGWMGATNVGFTPDETADGQVTANAQATVPMALMQMFGKEPVALAVECDAKFEVANTDIMFVLDVTGSMNCAASDTPSTCSNNGGNEKSNARIKALRTAVVDFFDTINGAVDDSARLRIGFVPYSSGVRVGQLLREKNASWLRDNWTYQSRVANFKTKDYLYTDGAETTLTVEVYHDEISRWNCEKYGRNESFSGFSGGSNPKQTGGGPPPASTTHIRYENNAVDAPWSSSTDWGWSGAPDNDNSSRSCRRKRYEFTRTYDPDPIYRFTNWTYKPVQYNVSQYKTGSAMSLAAPTSSAYVPDEGSYSAQELANLTGTYGLSNFSVTWDGCVEERQWVTQATFSTIPSTAYDLDIDTLPSTDETRWRPTLSSMIYRRATDAEDGPTSSNYWQPSTDNTYYACPKAAQKLTTMTKAQVESYVSASNGFVPIGGTYHDFGMLWGARLLSPTGIFGDENATAPNGKPISRHMIFMTDGDMSPNSLIYGLYGMEQVDQRIGGTDNPSTTNLKARHNSRFTAICNAARAKNITIWVVAYAQTMTSELQNCANPGKAFYASSDEQLKEQFKQIASQIAQLRLSR